MNTRIFDDIQNPNADIFNIPSEEGSSDDDRGNASIGDATMKHIEGLHQKVMIFDHFIKMPDGNLFSIQPNLKAGASEDKTLKEYDHEEVENIIRVKKLSPAVAEIYRQSIKTRIEANNADFEEKASEDVLDQRENLISYGDWESNPGMSGTHWDMPSTPKPISIPAGNCSQMFYDHFPEDHPDARFINKFLHMINKDWDEITPKFANFMENLVVNESGLQQETIKYLSLLVHEIANTLEDPVELTKTALSSIEEAHRQRLFRKLYNEEYHSDKMIQDFNKMCREYDSVLEASKDKAATKNKIFNNIKILGKQLFKTKEMLADTAGRRGKLERRWAVYHKMKKRYQPPVIFKGVDINKAFRNELMSLFNIDLQQALKIISLRPFASLDALKTQGLINFENLVSKNQVLLDAVSDIKTTSKEAIKQGNLSIFTSLPLKLIKAQKENSQVLNNDEWKQVWECYNIEKANVVKTLKLLDKTGAKHVSSKK